MHLFNCITFITLAFSDVFSMEKAAESDEMTGAQSFAFETPEILG